MPSPRRPPRGFVVAALVALALSGLKPYVAVLQAATAKTVAASDNGCTLLGFNIQPTGSNRLLMVGETHFDPDDNVTTTLTLDGVPQASPRNTISFSGNARKMHEWAIVAPATTNIAALFVYTVGTVDGDCGAGATAFSGVHQTVPLGTAVITTEQVSGQCDSAVSGGASDGSIWQLAFGNSTTLSYTGGTLGWEQEGLDAGGPPSVGSQGADGAASGTLTTTLGASGLNTCIGEVILPASAGVSCRGGLALLGIGGCE